MSSVKTYFKIRILFILIFLFTTSLYAVLTRASFAEEEPWKNEFNTLCGDTQKAVNLGQDDLKMLITRCEKLYSDLEASEAPQKKAFIYRIEKCKNFYQFLIELLETERNKK